jgi:glycosyltransferase involved in cell wall biosynthesis
VAGSFNSPTRVTCLVFGPNPSALVRGIARGSRANQSGISWKTVQLEPYFENLLPNFVPETIKRKFLRLIGKLLTPIIFLLQIRKIYVCDILYVIKSPPLWVSWMIQKARVVKILDFDDPIWIDSMSGMPWFQKTIKRFDGFTCDNEIVLEHVLDMDLPSNCKRGKVLVAELSISDISDLDDARSEIGSNKFGEVNITWVGSFSTFSYVAGIADALRRVLVELPSAMIHLYGPSREQIRELNLPNNQITWRESYGRSEMAHVLKSSQIGLFPLDDLPLSYLRGTHKVNTYSAFGVPTLSSNVPGISRSITDGVNGYVCKDYADWVKNILLIARNKELQHKLSTGARQHHLDYLENMIEAPKALVTFGEELRN